MNIATLATIISMVGAIGGGGYWFATELENKVTEDELQVVETKADYGLDIQIEKIISRLSRLERKALAGTASQYELQEIQYLRRELSRLRSIRYGRDG